MTLETQNAGIELVVKIVTLLERDYKAKTISRKLNVTRTLVKNIQRYHTSLKMLILAFPLCIGLFSCTAMKPTKGTPKQHLYPYHVESVFTSTN